MLYNESVKIMFNKETGMKQSMLVGCVSILYHYVGNEIRFVSSFSCLFRRCSHQNES